MWWVVILECWLVWNFIFWASLEILEIPLWLLEEITEYCQLEFESWADVRFILFQIFQIVLHFYDYFFEKLIFFVIKRIKTRWSIFIWVEYGLKDVQNVGEDWTYLLKIPVVSFYPSDILKNKNWSSNGSLNSPSSWPITFGMNFAIGMCCKRGYFVQQVLTKYSLFQRSHHTLDHD